MLVDVFRRPEAEGKFSHLAVPHNEPIPQEVTDWEWHDEARGIDLNEDLESWPEYGIEKPGEQLSKKRYAITSVKKMTTE
ncbi:DUF6139 family protein [Diaphorobacter aerolatus]|uniref:Uncharacterized protein n=1 Tax=Diaphorobacter aerolatus TaxID=1288495 RepID=A0A7H0GG92_9BURK|nr:DUF6139 family protein [Diaphorobacter aerolatus]QNP47308.1 hypothetical protein H9K75_13145 [Diaphorobacter aerolatus]